MNDPGLNQLLQWSVENSDASRKEGSAAAAGQQRNPAQGLNVNALAQLLGNAPSDAESMVAAMQAIVAPVEQVDVENKLIAWENFELLIEVIDNANNMESLKLWTPLLGQLESALPESRQWAAECLSTAVQNNVRSQERLLAIGGVPKLAALATAHDQPAIVRKKAVNALSSEVRNYQPALDELLKVLPAEFTDGGKSLDAGDMDAVSTVIDKLRKNATKQ